MKTAFVSGWWRKSALLACVAALIAGGAALLSPGGAADLRLRPDDPALTARGAVIYAAQCAACHGANLEGAPDWRQRDADGLLPAPPHDATGHTWHHADAQLFALTKYGPAALVGGGYRSAMPGYEGVLSDDDIIAVLSFIKSTWPPAIRARNDAINAAQAR